MDVITRATSSDLPPTVEMAPGVTVRHVTAGPFEGLAKEDLPAQLCAFTAGVMRIEAVREPGWYDLVHSHYWLSGQVAWLAAERWDVPLVHTMHTMAKVKNLTLADGDSPEPVAREIGEAQVVAAADRLVANTDEEAKSLVELYDADPARVVTVPPGVDLELFRPGSAAAARRRLGLPADAAVLLFVGRIQPLKAPDVLLRAVARLLETRPELADRLVVAVVGGLSGSGLTHPDSLRRSDRAARPVRPGSVHGSRSPAVAGRLVPRGRPHGGAVVQRVVRVGCHRVAGLRHPGRGDRRRRAPHSGARRGLGGSRREPLSGRLRARHR